MSNYNLTNQEISSSFQQVMQHDKPTGLIYDGTGSLIENLSVTSSEAIHATTASYAENAANPQWTSIQNKPSGLVSGAAQVDALLPSGTVSGSTQVLGGTNIVSSSAQVKDFLPSGTVSGSTQITDGSTIVSGSYVSSIIAGSNISIDQASGNVTINSTTTASADWNNLTNKPAGIVSGSSQIDVSLTTGNLTSSRIDGQVASALSASYALTASVLLGSIESASYADNALSASHAEHSDTTQEVIINVKNTSGGTLTVGTPVYATGVTGDNINVEPAVNSSASTMPAIAVIQQELSNNQVGEATVQGKLIGVDTSGFTAGRNIYVHNGDFTDTKPTGSALIQNIGVVGKVNASEGEIIIQGSGRSNDVPNIQEGYAWVGDGSGVPQAVATSSFEGGTIDTGSFATTGSNTFIGNQIISGSVFTKDVSPGPATAFRIDAGGASPVLEINNSALATITGTDYVINGDGVVNGNSTITGNTTQNGAGLISGSLIVQDASGAGPTNIFDVDNTTNTVIGVSNPSLAGITGTEVVINTQNGDTRFDGGSSSKVESFLPLIVTSSNASSIFKDAQAGPATSFAVNDGTNNVLQIENAALAGIVGSSLSVTGNSAFSGNQTVTGKQVVSDILEVTGSTGQAVNIKDAQAGPGTMFTINDGSSNVFNVNNNALAGITGESLSFAGKSHFTQDVKFSSKISSTVGTVSIASSTASIDFSSTQMNVLTLPSSGNTHIIGTNQGDGQVVNVLVKSTGNTATVTLDSTILQPSGSEYTSTPLNGGRDILTLTTYDYSTSSETYLINVTNLV